MATTNFGKAFRAARKAGKSEFTFGGKRYHTRTTEEEKRNSASRPAAAASNPRDAGMVANTITVRATRVAPAAIKKPAQRPTSSGRKLPRYPVERAIGRGVRKIINRLRKGS